MSIAEHPFVQQIISLAKAEDFGAGDLSSALLGAPEEMVECHLVVGGDGILAGQEIARAVLGAYDRRISLLWRAGVGDGGRILAGDTLATLSGPRGAILSAERVFLNFLQRLSGIATLTRRYVDSISGSGAAIYDTRKTTPGLRLLEKYAVRCGGGRNHRFGLFDAVLLKDNHIAGVPVNRLAGTLFDMLNRLGGLPQPPEFVEVEVDSLEQLVEVFKVLGVEVVLLDNFDLDMLRRAALLRNELRLRGMVELEASGGVTLETVGAIAGTGVERISVGAITHSAPALDMSLEQA